MRGIWHRAAIVTSAATAGLAMAGMETWREVRSPHFIAYTDARESEAREALREFEAIREAFKAIFPGIRVDPPKPLVVFIHQDEASMKQLLPGEFEGPKPKRSAGYYLSRGDRSYALLRLDARSRDGQPYHVLYHEFTHGILNHNFPAIPLWLNEGFAEFYGGTRIQPGGVHLGRISESSLDTLRRSKLLPLEALLKVGPQSPEYREGDRTGVFYAEAWALVHYLVMDEGARKADLLKRYLTALEQDPDPLAAARLGWGDLGALQSALFAYIRQSRFLHLKLPMTVRLAERDFTARMLPASEALVVRAEFLRDKGSPEASRDLLRQAVALDPKFPPARVATAVDQYQSGDRESARASLEVAEHLGSQDYRTPLLLAQLALEQDASSPGTRQEIRTRLEAARRLGPGVPEVHLVLCRFLASEASRDPAAREEALAAGRKALELDPENPNAWATFGYACMAMELEVPAKTVGERLRTMEAHPAGALVNAHFQPQLARFLDYQQRRRTPGPPVEAAGSPSGPPPAAADPGRLKFSLPDHLAPLGREILVLSMQGREAEAIPLVEAALANARAEVDRKALRSLREALAARVRRPSAP